VRTAKRGLDPELLAYLQKLTKGQTDEKRQDRRLINQWLMLDAQARQSLPGKQIDEINAQLISALPPQVRAMVIERFRGGA
jgi:hypothetical protein